MGGRTHGERERARREEVESKAFRYHHMGALFCPRSSTTTLSRRPCSSRCPVDGRRSSIRSRDAFSTSTSGGPAYDGFCARSDDHTRGLRKQIHQAHPTIRHDRTYLATRAERP